MIIITNEHRLCFWILDHPVYQLVRCVLIPNFIPPIIKDSFFFFVNVVLPKTYPVFINFNYPLNMLKMFVFRKRLHLSRFCNLINIGNPDRRSKKIYLWNERCWKLFIFKTREIIVSEPHMLLKFISPI